MKFFIGHVTGVSARLQIKVRAKAIQKTKNSVSEIKMTEAIDILRIKNLDHVKPRKRHLDRGE